MRIEFIKADITTLAVDAIVNAANSHLAHGGGVAGAIVRRGGQIIQDESDRIGFVPVGNAAVTGAGDLPCRYVIHAVGPVNGEGDEDRKLRDATVASLERAEELKLGSIAFPAISTGIFGYPLPRCARIMTNAVHEFGRRAKSLERVVFCLFDDTALHEFENAWKEIAK
ncbi:MAG: macro domain-containing protein [Thermoanaerobaculia bacterium]